jgi:4-hydroxy-3-polyprenylbenzoate decarboxylase
MIVVPCSAGTLGAIANGISRDLLQRAADVTLKERRPLVLAFRESPYSLVHIENMRRAALAGAIIAPPSPAFYVASPTVERFLDAYCGRVARLLGLDVPGESYQWKGRKPR